MNKRIAKRHKRQVARAKSRLTTSEPDLRTLEEIQAAREAGRPPGGWRKAPEAQHLATSPGGHAGPAVASTAKGDTGT